jgi:hypothetical protein
MFVRKLQVFIHNLMSITLSWHVGSAIKFSFCYGGAYLEFYFLGLWRVVVGYVGRYECCLTSSCPIWRGDKCKVSKIKHQVLPKRRVLLHDYRVSQLKLKSAIWTEFQRVERSKVVIKQLLLQLNALVFIKSTRYYNLYFLSLYS